MGNARRSSNPSPALGNARHHRGLGGPSPASQNCQLTYDRSTPHLARKGTCAKRSRRTRIRDKDQPDPAHAWAEERVSVAPPRRIIARPAVNPPMAREPHITGHHAHRSTPAVAGDHGGLSASGYRPVETIGQGCRPGMSARDVGQGCRPGMSERGCTQPLAVAGDGQGSVVPVIRMPTWAQSCHPKTSCDDGHPLAQPLNQPNLWTDDCDGGRGSPGRGQPNVPRADG